MFGGIHHSFLIGVRGVGGGGQKVSNVNKDLFIYEVKRPLDF